MVHTTCTAQDWSGWAGSPCSGGPHSKGAAAVDSQTLHCRAAPTVFVYSKSRHVRHDQKQGGVGKEAGRHYKIRCETTFTAGQMMAAHGCLAACRETAENDT